MTKARDLAGFSTGSITNTTADGLILKGDGSSTDVVIKNGANATVATVSDGSTNLSVAGSVTGALARGAIQVGNSSGVAAALAKGTSGYVLTAGANDLSWAAAGGGATEFINETTVSNAASYAFTAMDSSKYKSYILYVYNLVTANNVQQIKARTSPDGTNFDSGSADYSWRLNYQSSSTADTTANYARLAQSSSYNANTGFSGTITILDPHNTSTETRVMFQYMTHYGAATGAPEIGYGAFVRVTAEASLGLQIFAASGNITSAKITAYGITNS